MNIDEAAGLTKRKAKAREIRFRVSNQMLRWLDDQSNKQECTMAQVARTIIAEKMWAGRVDLGKLIKKSD